MMRRVFNFLRHLQQGTLLERLRWGWEERKESRAWKAREDLARRRKQQWDQALAQGGTLEIEVGAGARLLLEPGNRLAENICLHQFEIRERTFVERYLRDGDVFVDIGANIGLYTVIAGKCVGSAGLVIAFEPAGATRARLEANIRLNSLTNVQVQSLALSDKNDSVPLNVPMDGFDAWASLGVPTDGQAQHSELVETATWDGFANDRGLEGLVAMMKIDVEGWERRVLAGAWATLSETDAPLLQVEFSDDAARAAGGDCASLYRALDELGYCVCRFDAEANKLVPDAMRPEYPFDNLYATKRLQEDNERLAAAMTGKSRW